MFSCSEFEDDVLERPMSSSLYGTVQNKYSPVRYRLLRTDTAGE